MPTLRTYDNTNTNDFDDLLSDQQNGNDHESEGNWEENWLFQKRKHKSDTTTTASVSPSIGMLVPSPTHEVKTLIGDKSADEISDLSEADDGDSDDDTTGNQSDSQINCDLPHVLVESKTIIGGKNEVTSFDETSIPIDDLLQPASLISLQANESGPIIMEAKNNLIFLMDDQEQSGMESSGNSMSVCVDSVDSVDSSAQPLDFATIDDARSVAIEIVDSVLQKIDMLSDVSPTNEEIINEIHDNADTELEIPVVPIAIVDERLQTKEIPVPAPR